MYIFETSHLTKPFNNHHDHLPPPLDATTAAVVVVGYHQSELTCTQNPMTTLSPFGLFN
ncbi:hypothetical protein HanPSC8_Chr16g0734721 [Helianthus annuus]|nr:hypothetical protein HanHA89_Chr16g0675881 [Helianthus annuus]KAJ0822662.1 hypothetical protein HanPSC8_Chr16g0734721 [Helianthus annuus]